MGKEMKGITFEQVLQYLKELEENEGHGAFIRELIKSRMGNNKTAYYPSLTLGEREFLNRTGLSYKRNEDIQEWQINLIYDDN